MRVRDADTARGELERHYLARLPSPRNRREATPLALLARRGPAATANDAHHGEATFESGRSEG